MASPRQIPEKWLTLMERKGLSSIRALAMAADLSHVTVNRLVFGDRFFTTDQNVQKVADTLGVDFDVIYGLIGRPTNGAEPYVPPASSALLTKQERKMVDDIINTLARKTSTPVVQHPEQCDVDLAADTSHGPSETQREAS